MFSKEKPKESYNMFEVDIEEPNRDPWTISLARAIKDYSLDKDDISLLSSGGIVWWRDVAISKHED